MVQTVFNRYEKKYLLTRDVYLKLREKLQERMVVDQYGEHTICNIYYDTKNYDLIRKSIEKPVYKEKIRLRSYGVPSLDSTVYLEIKKKYQKVVNKRRIAIKLSDAYNLIEKAEQPLEDSQILNEIKYFLKHYKLVNKTFLAYDRIALYDKEDHDFRITFDHNIRSRNYDTELEKGDYGKYLLDENYYLMETKIYSSTPLWFTEILSELKIYPTSFSKYGNIYKNKYHQFNVDNLMNHYIENWDNLGGQNVKQYISQL